MTGRSSLIAAALACVVTLCGCGGNEEASTSRTELDPSQTPTQPMTTPSTPTPSPAQSAPSRQATEGTVVRFSARGVAVDVTIGADHPTSRDFLSRLPMTISLEDLSRREKIAYLSPRLDVQGSPGSDPEDGDLIYFTPWGNLGFYYNADGIDYSDQTINLGAYRASQETLDKLEGPQVKVAVVER